MVLTNILLRYVGRYKCQNKKIDELKIVISENSLKWEGVGRFYKLFNFFSYMHLLI